MKKFVVFLFLIPALNLLAQQGVVHNVKPVGEYAKINAANDAEVVRLLLDSTYNKKILIDSIEHSPNTYTPPVLYVLSNVLFKQNMKTDACFWFYLAQLRARYDVNRCTDKTATAYEYNNTYGPLINNYAFKEINLDLLKVLMKKLADFERSNEEAYDQRWINLSGMNAISAGMGDEKKATDTQLSLPKEQWPAIKEKTIKDYMQGFDEIIPTILKMRESK